MKLSEAIRLGGLMKPQAFGEMLWENHTCAIGAALDAIGKLTDLSVSADAAAEWPFLNQWIPTCCNQPERQIRHQIMHLNDKHRRTRAAIADWVETIENAQVKEPEVETVAR